MHKDNIAEAQTMYDAGHTFYAIAGQLKQWYGGIFTPAQVAKALDCKDNPVGHKKFKGVGHRK